MNLAAIECSIPVAGRGVRIMEKILPVLDELPTDAMADFSHQNLEAVKKLEKLKSGVKILRCLQKNKCQKM